MTTSTLEVPSAVVKALMILKSDFHYYEEKQIALLYLRKILDECMSFKWTKEFDDIYSEMYLNKTQHINADIWYTL